MLKLSLKKERLAELTTEELHAVVGAQATKLCVSLLGSCQSYQTCTTAMSCGGGCDQTWNCA